MVLSPVFVVVTGLLMNEAVKEYTAKFDRVQLDTVCVPIEVSGE